MGHLKPFRLLPPKEGVCQECGVDHPGDIPHMQNSLLYQYYFFNKNGRWPTWEDAMAHCDDDMKLAWCEALANRGVKVDGED